MFMKNIDNIKLNKIFTIVTVFVFTVIFFFLNYSTVLQWNDDFYFSNVKSIKDIFISTYNEFLYWNGRVFTNIILRLMLIMDKIIFNILNTIIFILLNYLIVWYSTYRLKICQIFKVILFTFSIFLTIFFIPDLNVLFWVVGSINYIWPSMLLLFTFSIFFKLIIDSLYNDDYDIIENNNLLNIIYLYFFTSLISGNSNENSSLAILLMMFLSILYFKINNVKYDKKINSIAIIFTISYLLLLFSPGSQSRSRMIQETTENNNFFYNFIFRTFSLLFRYYEQFAFINTISIFLLSFILYYILVMKKNKKIIIKDVYLNICVYVFSLFSNFVLIFSPLQPERAKTFAFFLLLIAVLRLISLYLLEFDLFKPLFVAIYSGLLILFIPLDIVVMNSLLHKKMFDDDIKYINELKNNGTNEITIQLNRETLIDKKDYKIPERIKSLTSYALLTDKYASILGVDKIIIK